MSLKVDSLENMSKLPLPPLHTASHEGNEDPVYTGIIVTDIIVGDESSSRKWDDTFFDGEEEVIEVFDFDYSLLERIEVNASVFALSVYCWALSTVGLIIYPHPLSMYFATIVVIYSLWFCFFRRRIHWYVYSLHLCITREGIHLVQDKRKTCYGWVCTDRCKTSKFVPFDKITVCDIQESVGNTSSCDLNELSTVNVDTISSSARWFTRHELVISGLKDRHRFKETILAMKQVTSVNSGQVNLLRVEIISI